MTWVRYRFEANEEDYRPIIWPPLGPYWCSGYGGDHSIVVAYLPKAASLFDFWPEASNIDSEELSDITYSGRFAKPEWWNE